MKASGRASPVRHLLWVAFTAALVLVLAVLWLVLNQLRVPSLPPAQAKAAPSELIERGAYLARAGNCAACHTARGGEPYAGGRAIETPFGQVFAGNLTPHDTGLGQWSADAFWRALHHGQSRDGRLLYPAFPYASFTHVSREDSDALFAFLQNLPPVAQPNLPHALRFPYGTQTALAVWRELYFAPATWHAGATQSVEWNRGAYLVNGLGHCGACHSARDALGGPVAGGALAGALMPQPGWYAPSLRSVAEAGVAHWELVSTVELLKTGVSGGASTMGPMAEVVLGSTQHLTNSDLLAVAVYLKSLVPQAIDSPAYVSAKPEQMALGKQVYKQHCADCHGEQGQGATSAYPPLAGNRAITMTEHANPVLAILGGGFAPATEVHPRPYGMPPFRTLLSDAEIAAVASFMRQSWGNQANAVSPLHVQRLR